MKKLALLTNYYEIPQLGLKYIKNFQFISDFFAVRGIEFSQVSMKTYNYDKKCFTEFLYHDHGKIIKRQEEYVPDILWNRVSSGGSYIGEATPFQTFPHRQIIDLSANKYLMYLYFSEYMPYTALLSDFMMYDEVQSHFGEMVVLKVVNASNSSGVFFLKKSELINKREQYGGLGYSYIVQNYVELGEEGGTIYEFRFVIVDDKISYCMKRLLRSGDNTDLSAGWCQEVVNMTEIPNQLGNIVNALLEKRNIGKDGIFTLDFGFNRNKKEWFLIEMNDFPGLAFEETQSQTFARYLIHVYQLIEKTYISNQLFHV